MAAFITRRVFFSIIVLFLVSVMVFSALRLLPGDPIYMYFAKSQIANIDPKVIEQVRHEYHLDQPIIVQYYYWINDMAHGNLGYSLVN